MGTLNFPAGATVYVDTNIVIYSVESVEPYSALVRPLWEAARSGHIRLLGSELHIIETLAAPLKRGNRALVDVYEQVLNAADFELMPMTRDIMRRGAGLRADFNLKTPDAIHAATAIEARCSTYLTNDSGFRRITRLSVLILQDLLRI